MAIYTKLNKTQIQKLLKHFPTLPQKDFAFKGIGMGTVNTYYKITYARTAVYYLKIDEVGDEKRLKNEILVFKNLHDQQHKLSYQTPFPLKAKNRRYYVPFRKKFVLVFPEVGGKALFKGLSLRHLRTIGQKMAELHKLSVKNGVKHHRFNRVGLNKTYKSIKKDLIKKHPDLDVSIRYLINDFNQNYPKRMQEVLIHADIFPENIHWKDGKFFGMIDFEAAGLGAPLFDVCVGIHACCLKGIKIDLKKMNALLHGYQSVRKFSKTEQKYFGYYMNLTALRFLLTRLKDFELPGADPKAENFKDYREYVSRLDELSKPSLISTPVFKK